jgi:hypothetical protein
MTVESPAGALDEGNTAETAQTPRDALRRLARALSGVKQRINHPKLPNDACYAGIAYRLPEPPMRAAELLYDALGALPVNKSLDRIDPNGNYAMGNIRYATPLEQTVNRRPQNKRVGDQEDEWEDE